MSRSRLGLRNERGATLALIAVTSTGLIAMLALAIDLSMLFDTRAEAQRAADAAALAGASAYLIAGTPPVNAAHDQAMDYAGRNQLRKSPIDTSSEVAVFDSAAKRKVTVYVSRDSVPTFFAAIFGIRFMPIGAMASAVASNGGNSSNCVKPWAIPDMWFEADTLPSGNNPAQDINKDRVWDYYGNPDEQWEFNPPALGGNDVYVQADPVNPNATQTGYGSHWRDAANGGAYSADYGRPIIVKAQNPANSLTSPFFYRWLPANVSAGLYDDYIIGCNPESAALGTNYTIQPGNAVGPTDKAVDSLISLDPNAQWLNGTVVNSDPQYGNWLNSPRVVTVAVFDPHLIAGITGGGNLQLQFNNFAKFFLEPIPSGGGPKPDVMARFLYYVAGGNDGIGNGTLVRKLQLVE